MRTLVIRIGAYGDVVITTPLIRYLKSQGAEILYLGSERAEEVLRGNPNVDKFVLHPKDSVPTLELDAYFEKIKVNNNCDNLINLCESVEVRLAVSPNFPQWNWTKKERLVYCDRNYYEFCFEHAGVKISNSPIDEIKDFYRPEMFFTNEEEDTIAEIRKQCLGHKIIMWGLSGSGRQKTYPYVPYIIGDIMREMRDAIVILVGGETCKILECALPNHRRILKKSGEFSFRESALMAKYSDLVISPDTGFLHCAGMWDTPKIGLLTHTTIENITKHFKNDFSLESLAPCAPCFRLIDDAGTQCPTERASNACLCMGKDAMPAERILSRIKEVLCH